ncbi:MAG TPA: hypothetical protein VMV43_04115 [Candidatus Nanopelagicaceae bacterium]|nr:hypothetical protein [Candidatus Nanopelagicaceae bacterium]
MAYKSTKTKSSSKPKGKSKVALIAVLAIFCLGIFALVGAFWFFAIAPPTTTPSDVSTFTAIDYLTGDDKSDEVYIGLYVPINITETGDWEAIDFRNFTNYEVLTGIDNDEAETVIEDLTDYPAFYLRVISGATENYHLLVNNYENFDYTCYVFNNSADAIELMVDGDLTVIDGTDVSGNYTVFYTISEPTDYILCPTYDPTISEPVAVNLSAPITWYTTYNVIQFEFNITIGIEDEDPAQVNITITDNNIAFVFFDVAGEDQMAYIVFNSVLSFDYTAINQVSFELLMGADIGLVGTDIGTFEVSDATDLEAILGTFTTLHA